MPASADETRPWANQLNVDDASYRSQLAYLLERSAFYRDKLGLASVEDAGGLADIARVHELVKIPIFCIGGVKLENLDAVIEAGATHALALATPQRPGGMS